ncbi:response regulator [Anabaena sp. UHCC 0187]|uniref:response regulator n=1 Tax=Anabaena sp. UHCC 0187 TaxID=2590018 RepID=UPI0014455424|nr:hypothetical protein [Anabaena sp. UHCC 0187]MTJ11140.1 response regulator [Anabaena sp. UHCC 0187]
MNKILIVEPEPLLLSLLAELLTLYDLYPIATTSFKQGYELTKQEKPNLILCGHSSTYLNSYEKCWTFLTKLRQELETANIPFIFMAGSDLQTIHNWQNYLTSQDILLKPFNSQVLLQKIHSHLQSSQNKSQTEQKQKSLSNIGYTHQNAFFTEENQSAYQYSYLFA